MTFMYMYDRQYYVYIMASGKNGTLYIGVTNNLARRGSQHKNKENRGFTERYNVDKLVYYETYGDVSQALYREKQLKWWKRAWKITLIEQDNPGWEDLYSILFY